MWTLGLGLIGLGVVYVVQAWLHVRLSNQMEDMMATIDEVLAEVAAQTSKIASIDVLLDGLRQQVADLLAQVGTIPPELQAKIDAVFDTAKQNSAAIDAAIAENTPPSQP